MFYSMQIKKNQQKLEQIFYFCLKCELRSF